MLNKIVNKGGQDYIDRASLLKVYKSSGLGWAS